MTKRTGGNLSVVCIEERDGACAPKLLPVAELVRRAGLGRADDERPGGGGGADCVLSWRVSHNHVEASLARDGRAVPLRLQPVHKKILLAVCIHSHLGESLSPDEIAQMRGPQVAVPTVYARISEIRKAVAALRLGIEGKEVVASFDGAYRIGETVSVVLPGSLACAQAEFFFCYLRGSALRRRFSGNPGTLSKFEAFARERGLGSLLDR